MNRDINYRSLWNSLYLWAKRREGRVIGGRELVMRMAREARYGGSAQPPLVSTFVEFKKNRDEG